MKFIEKLAVKAKEYNGDAVVEAVYIGLSYAMVVLQDKTGELPASKRCGLAFVFKDDHVSGCNIGLPKRPLAGSRAAELLDFAGKGSLANSIALATANAVLAPLVKADSAGDFIENFEMTAGMKVGMVGHFGPLAKIMEEKGVDLTIFDMHPEPFSRVQGPEMVAKLLPECEIALITATTIINESFDEVLAAARNCKYVAILGPSAPLASCAFEGLHVSCAAGALVRDEKAMIASVVEAGGMRVFSPYLEKVNCYY